MSLTILCQSCQRTLRVPEDLLGQAVRCPNCSHTFIAPESVEAEPHLSAAPRRENKYDESRPARLPAHDNERDEDHGKAPRLGEKPGKVQAIAVMVLVGGILACLWGLGSVLASGFLCCLWPGSYYSLVMGSMAIAKGLSLLGDKAYRLPPPQGIATMMIINIINGDTVNLTLGIIVTVFLSDKEVKAYFRG